MHKIPVLGSIVVSIPACHARDRESIPHWGARNNFFSTILNDPIFDKELFLLPKNVIFGCILVSFQASNVGDHCSIPRR